jgi:hypothetical protein
VTLTAYGMGAGFSCMVCGMDLWDVGRYVSAGAVVICDSCIGILKDAVDGAEGSGNTEVMLPPRTSGPVPDDSSAAAIAKAFVMTFGSEYDDLDDYLEAASELGPVLAQAGAQFGGARFTTRVNRIRFTNADQADVRFQVCMNGALTGWPFQGTAVRGDDGHWRVTRETVWRVVPGGGGPFPGPRRFSS